MLVLSRKEQERILITGPCVITLLAIRGGDKARLGLEAATGTAIFREEILVGEELEEPRKLLRSLTTPRAIAAPAA